MYAFLVERKQSSLDNYGHQDRLQTRQPPATGPVTIKAPEMERDVALNLTSMTMWYVCPRRTHGAQWHVMEHQFGPPPTATNNHNKPNQATPGRPGGGALTDSTLFKNLTR